MRKLFITYLFYFNALFGTNYIADYLDIGVGARPLGMGGCFVSQADDPTSLYWNPAGLSSPDKLSQVFLMHTSLYKGMYKQDAIFFRYPLNKLGIGIGYVRISGDGIPFTKENGFLDWGLDHIPSTGDLGEYNGIWDPGEQVIYDFELKSDTKNIINFGIGYKPKNRLRAGISSKILHENIGGYKAYGIGFDLGLIYTLNSTITFGTTIKDMPSTFIRWSTGHSERKRPHITIGGSKITKLSLLRSEMNLSFELETEFEKTSDGSIISTELLSIKPRIGAEIKAIKIASLRTGYNNTTPSFGIGLNISYFSLDYAYTINEPGRSHRVSLVFELPKPKPKKEPQTISSPQPEKERLVHIAEEKTEKQEPEIKKEIETKTDLDGTKIIACLFESGKEEILEEYKDTLNSIGKFLQENKEYDIILCGHTDNKPVIRKYKDNYELSLARANRIAEYLHNKFGIEKTRMIIKGYGPDNPITDNLTEEARAKNRRVEIIFLKRR